MKYRRLGNSGLKVSALCLGTSTFGSRVDPQQAERIIGRSAELGINFIDTANNYGSSLAEEYVGNAVKGTRDQWIVGTKVAESVGEGPNGCGASRWHIMGQADASLKRLGTDYIDFYQIHFPDPTTPIDETLRAMDDLVRQGKVRYIGCANFPAWRMCEAIWTSKLLNLTPPLADQVEYSLISRSIEQDLIPFCLKYGIGIIPYFALGGGFLTGKYRPGEKPPAGSRLTGSSQSNAWPELRRFKKEPQPTLTERNFALLGCLERFSAERNHTVTDLAIAWLLGQPVVSSVIIGATKPDQLGTNTKGVGWHLQPDDFEEIGRLLGE